MWSGGRPCVKEEELLVSQDEVVDVSWEEVIEVNKEGNPHAVEKNSLEEVLLMLGGSPFEVGRTALLSLKRKSSWSVGMK